MERLKLAPPNPNLSAEFNPNLGQERVDAAFDKLVGDLVAGEVEQAEQDFALWEQELQSDGVDQTSANIYPAYEDVTAPNIGELSGASSPESTYPDPDRVTVPISDEVVVVDPQIDYETTEAEAEDFIMEAAKPEPQLPAWPEGNPDGTIPEGVYSTRLNIRLGDVGQYLDAARDLINNEAEAEDWLKLKMDIYNAKRVEDTDVRVELVKDLERAAYDFLRRL